MAKSAISDIAREEIQSAIAIIESTFSLKFIANLEISLANELKTAMTQQAEMTRRLLVALKTADETTLVCWWESFWQKVAIVATRRELRLEAILEAMDSEAKDAEESKETKCYDSTSQRVSDALVILTTASKFPQIFDSATADFRETSVHVVADLETMTNEEDEDLNRTITDSNKSFLGLISFKMELEKPAISTADRDKMVAAHQTRIAEIVAETRISRDKKFQTICQQNSEINHGILTMLSMVSIDNLDATSLGGANIEDLCFGKTESH